MHFVGIYVILYIADYGSCELLRWFWT